MVTTAVHAATWMSGPSGPGPVSPRPTVALPSATATPEMLRLVDHQGRAIGQVETSRHFGGLGPGRPTVLLRRPG